MPLRQWQEIQALLPAVSVVEAQAEATKALLRERGNKRNWRVSEGYLAPPPFSSDRDVLGKGSPGRRSSVRVRTEGVRRSARTSRPPANSTRERVWPIANAGIPRPWRRRRWAGSTRRLVHGFRESNHIRRRGRVCRSRCGRRDGD